MSEVRVQWNEAVFRHEFQSWDGVVAAHLRPKIREIETRAIATVGVDTRKLQSAIDSTFDVIGGDLVARVGANPQSNIVGYGMYHHEGTRPHPIVARNAEFLRFPDRRAGRRGGVVVTRSVRHPGTKPNPFLTQPLREVFF